MQQLNLQLFGFDLPQLIDHFENKETMYRWYPSEIVKKVLEMTQDQVIVTHFTRHHRQLWYREEIIEEFKMLAKAAKSHE